jgi:cold-inducible RNA-binding protein
MSKIYVGNLPFSADEAAVRDLFSQHGTVDSISMIMDRETGRPRGFAFVEMPRADAARAIQNLNGQDMGGRALKVNEAQDKPRGGGGGGGGGGGASSSLMVPTAVPSRITAPLGFESTTWNVSSSSSAVSPRTPTAIAVAVWPGRNVTSPEPATKSAPAVALPPRTS